MTNCVLLHWERFTVSHKETNLGCDSGMMASGGARILVESFGLRSEASRGSGIRLNGSDGMKV